jgi:GT2 family glycosyltransferase/glycosyltransferase involved in cell wall biosynthesis
MQLVVGNFVGIESGAAVGWVFSAAEPDRRYCVAVYVDGRHVSEAFADLYRNDVLLRREGDDWCGFRIDLTAALKPGVTHRIEARVLDDAGVVLKGAVIDYMVPAEAAAPARALDLRRILDDDHYRGQAGDVDDAVEHYRNVGWKRGLDPHPLFSTRFYIERLGRALVGDPVSDFLMRGASQRAETHPLLDIERYLREQPDVAASGEHPLFHYLRVGWREGVDAFRIFDLNYYERECPGLGQAGITPISHYLQFGWREGRRPHPDFDPELFQRLADSNVEPFTAFVHDRLPPVRANARVRPDDVDFSIIILNHNKSVFTLQCIALLRRWTDLERGEVIVVDNGSAPDDFRQLARYAHGVRLIRVDDNRGFGEGCNLGVDAACGRTLVFLNNDAFVTNGWLEPLLGALAADPAVGMVGSRLIYPDGTLQEAGASIAADGVVHQHGKGLTGVAEIYDKARPVDYVSAAALAMPASVFHETLGFDLSYDPAYYEDADLALKVAMTGRRVMYEPASVVVHLENGTSGDAKLGLELGNVVAANRLKFVQRWSEYLSGDRNGEGPGLIARPDEPRRSRVSRKTMALYTPYPLNPGGGERYLLSIASLLREETDCVLFTPFQVSRTRLRTLARELQLELDHVQLAHWDDRGGHAPFDYFVSLGNEALPHPQTIGRRNIYVCQFPFPVARENYARSWGARNAYDSVLVYSPFVAEAYAKAAADLGLAPIPVEIASPPTPQMRLAERRDGDTVRILNVGRFSGRGHCKRQDVLIELFAELVRSVSTPVELHLAGVLGPVREDRDYFNNLLRRARGLPVFFHLSVTPERLNELYGEATIYWHATGINDDVGAHPERFEHFGISILEAMSAGAIPVVLNHGNPGVLVQDGETGFLGADRDELLTATLAALNLEPGERRRVQQNARAKAATFAPEQFRARLLELFDLTPAD